MLGWSVCGGFEDTIEDLTARLKKRHSAKHHRGQLPGKRMEMAGDEEVDRISLRVSSFISMEKKSQPISSAALRLRYKAGVKVRVVGFRAYCQGRFNPDVGNSFKSFGSKNFKNIK